MTGFARLAWAAACLLLPSCFAPAFEDGQFSCPTGACPSGFDCVEGVCLRSSDAPRPDAAVSRPDAATPPADAAVPGPPDAAPPDASPPREAAVYRFDLDAGTWSMESATAFFNGARAPAADAIQTAWSHCRPGNTLCFGTAESWHCTTLPDADRWFTNGWSSLDEALATSPPTYTTAWDNFSGFLDRVEFNRDASWWHFRFFGAPRDEGAGVGQWTLNLVDWHGAAGSANHDTEWDAEPDAPPSAAAVIADYGIDTIWYLWTDDGTEYSRGEAGWRAPTAAAALAVDGAPPVELVTAAAHCDGVLFVVTRGD